MEPEAPRKLTLSTSDKYVWGVAGGLGRYFGVDAMLFRVAFGVSVVVRRDRDRGLPGLRRVPGC